MAKNYSIEMYDLEDNYIMSFKNYNECAKYFNTNANYIRNYVHRLNIGVTDKKRDRNHKKWVRLYRMNFDEMEWLDNEQRRL